MAQYNLEPRNGITYLDRPVFNHTNLDLPEIKEIENNQEYAEAVRLAKAEADKVDTETEDFPGKDVEIVTLGTGSSIPAKYRNGKYYFYLNFYIQLITRISERNISKDPRLWIHHVGCRRRYLWSNDASVWFRIRR